MFGSMTKWGKTSANQLISLLRAWN